MTDLEQAYLPQRVVSLQPSATVTLRDLGLLNRLVACTKYCLEVCPEAAGSAIVADSWTAKAHEILAAKPDLVIASVPYQVEALVEILKAGIRFLGLAPKTLADIYADIVAIGRIMGAEGVALEVVGEMQADIGRISEAMSSAPRPRVFCEEWGKPIIGSQPWVQELVEAAGGQFVGDPGKQITAAEIEAANPDVLIAAWCGAGDRVPLEKIVAQRGWQQMRAVETGRVFCIPDPLLNTPASTLIGGLKALAWAIHPELFPKPMGVRQMEVDRRTSEAPTTAVAN